MANESTHTIERISRVLAGERLSANAEGGEPSAGGAVDRAWPEHREAAVAVLKSLRDPPPEIAAVVDPETWTRAIAAALGDEVDASSDSKVEEVTESVSHFLRAPS